MNKKAFVKYISSLLIFGLNGVVANQIDMSSYEIVFLRTLIGSIFLLSIFLIKKEKFHFINNGKDLLFVILSGISMGASWLFLFEAYRQIGVSTSSLLYNFGPVIVMILSPLLFKEKFTLPKVIGFIIVLAGILLVNGNSALNGDGKFGIFCGFMSGIMYFFMITFNKKSKQIVGFENSVIQLTVSFLTVAVFVGIKQQFIMSIPADSIIWILIMGLVNTGFGCYLYFSSLSQLKVQTVVICDYLEPLSAIIFAALILNEEMTLLKIVGGILILGGAMIGEILGREKE